MTDRYHRELRELKLLAEVGRLFLALPPGTELYRYRDSGIWQINPWPFNPWPVSTGLKEFNAAVDAARAAQEGGKRGEIEQLRELTAIWRLAVAEADALADYHEGGDQGTADAATQAVTVAIVRFREQWPR